MPKVLFPESFIVQKESALFVLGLWDTTDLLCYRADSFWREDCSPIIEEEQQRQQTQVRS